MVNPRSSPIAIMSTRNTTIRKRLAADPAASREPLRLLVETNIIVDIIFARQPWVADAADLLAAIERGTAQGYVAAHAMTTTEACRDQRISTQGQRSSGTDASVSPPQESNRNVRKTAYLGWRGFAGFFQFDRGCRSRRLVQRRRLEMPSQ
jgi:hypothetical protein